MCKNTDTTKVSEMRYFKSNFLYYLSIIPRQLPVKFTWNYNGSEPKISDTSQSLGAWILKLMRIIEISWN